MVQAAPPLVGLGHTTLPPAPTLRHAGIHDIPITGAAAGGGGGGGDSLSLQRNRLGAVAAGGEGGERAPKRSSAAYQQVLVCVLESTRGGNTAFMCAYVCLCV